MTDLGNQRDVQARTKAATVRRGQLKEAVRWIMGDDKGRLYLADLVRESGALSRVSAITPELIMFDDGKRALGFKVLNDVRALDDARPFATLIATVLQPPTPPTQATTGEPDGGRDDDTA